MLVARSAARIFVSTPAWERLLRDRLGVKAPISWLPVPSNISVVDDAPGIKAIKEQYAQDGGLLLGHFSTYSDHIVKRLRELLPALLVDHPRVSAVLL